MREGCRVVGPISSVKSKASLDSSVGEDNPVGNCPFRRNHPENTPPPPTCLCTRVPEWECEKAVAECGIAEVGGRSSLTVLRAGREANNLARNRGAWMKAQRARMIANAYIMLRGVEARVSGLKSSKRDVLTVIASGVVPVICPHCCKVHMFVVIMRESSRRFGGYRARSSRDSSDHNRSTQSRRSGSSNSGETRQSKPIVKINHERHIV
jgi:hypothetical protein